MNLYDRRRRGGRRLQRKGRAERNVRVRLAALFLCLSMAAGFLPALALAANADTDGRVYLSSIVTFDSITLYDNAGAEVKDRALLKQGQALQLRYTYSITAAQCESITAETPYYLEVSPPFDPTQYARWFGPDSSGGAKAVWQDLCGRQQRLGGVPR